MTKPGTPPLYPFQPDASLEVTSQNTKARQQFVDLDSASRWFDTLVINRLATGESDGARAFPAADNGNPTEVWYLIVSGVATFVQSGGRRELLNPYDGVYFGDRMSGELVAQNGPVTWLTIASAGGGATPFSKRGGRIGSTSPGPSSRPAIIFSRKYIAPRQWPANTLGASAKPWWFYTVSDQSRWFHSACVSCIAPGGSSTFHSHMERFEGPYETFYIALKGTALIRGEYQDYLFEGTAPAGVYVPANGAHQIINNGEDLLWYLTISSRGNTPLLVDVYNMPSGADRPGYLDEYNRIIAARRARGLQLP
jgi:mannose-6-phosphate isomerase-like protein (cupin superfamily)